MFRSSLDTSIKPILCPRKSGPTHLKVAAPVIKHQLTVSNGELTSGGLIAPAEDIRNGALVWSLPLDATDESAESSLKLDIA